MLKHVFKFGLDILPSVVATIIGAYIVNHYIATKPAANAPVSATASTAEPKNADARSAPMETTVLFMPLGNETWRACQTVALASMA